jgi:hypothetical protein
LLGKVNTKVLKVQGVDGQGTVSLLVQAESMGVFQFSNAYQQTLIQAIAGKSEQDAQALLSGKPGVQHVTITLSGIKGQILPSQLAEIVIKVVSS